MIDSKSIQYRLNWVCLYTVYTGRRLENCSKSSCNQISMNLFIIMIAVYRMKTIDPHQSAWKLTEAHGYDLKAVFGPEKDSLDVT